MDKGELKKLIKDINNYVKDINNVEIASQIESDNLGNFLSAWRNGIKDKLNILDISIDIIEEK